MSDPAIPRSALTVLGRGASFNPPNRFDRIDVVDDLDHFDGDAEYFASRERANTEYLVDTSKSIIAYNDSPDVFFDASINPYRGCTHGCVYCYARPTHEYFGLGGGLDFETKVFCKRDAAGLLERELRARNWKPQLLAMSGVTDPYQPVEKQLGITRACLQVLAKFRNPVGIVTKNHLVTRDLDILGEMARDNTAHVSISVTTLDNQLAAAWEPRASSPARRLAAVEACAKAGVPVSVLVCPVVPTVNDREIPQILRAARDAGATTAHYNIVRLPGNVRPVFLDWLHRHFPDRAGRVESQLKQARNGKLYDSTWGDRFTGHGAFVDQIGKLFEVTRQKLGLAEHARKLTTDHFRVPGGQMSLFG
jgi:DNA repair photolyase